MANAIPANSKMKKEAPKAPEVILADPPSDPKALEAAKAALLARGQEIVASEKPDVPDELVNTLGQERNYGKIKSVSEHVYEVKDRKGEPTGETRVAIRVDH